MTWLLIRQTLRVRARSIAVWSIALSAGVVMMLAIFPSISQVDISQLLEAYPEGLMETFGIDSVEQFSTAIGYVNSELFSLLIPLAIVFLPIGIVNHCLPAAEEQHYLDNLLCTPVERWQVAIGAALASAIALVFALAVMVAASLAAAAIIGVELAFADIAQSCLSLLPLASLFGAVSLLVAGAGPGRGRTMGIAGGLMALAYIFSLMANFSDLFHQIRWVSPFYYYTNWLGDGIAWVEFAAMLTVAAGLTILGAILFERRDVAS